MTGHTERGEPPRSLAEALREEFDAQFGRPLGRAPEGRVRLVLVSIGGARHGVRQDELSGIERLAAVAPLPGHVPGRIGVAFLRGAAVPLFDARVLVGLAPEVRPNAPVLLAGRPPTLGLVVERVLGCVDVAPHLLGLGPGPRGPAPLCAVVALEDGPCPILSITALAEGLRTAAPAAGKESAWVGT